MKRLNRMDTPHMTWLETEALGWAPRLDQRGDPGEAGDNWAIAAACGYGLGRPIEDVRSRLRQAAACFAADAQRPEGWDCVPFDFFNALSIGEWGGRGAEVARKPRATWCDPESRSPEALREVLDAAVAGHAGEAVEARLEQLANASWSTPFARRVAVPAAALRLAVLRRDPTALQAALDASLAGHAWFVRGELALSWRGLLALGVLGPLAAARSLGLPFSAESPYLPLALLD